MSEAAFRQMIAACIRQTRPQSFRHGKLLRYPQRSISDIATAKLVEQSDDSQLEWQTHNPPAEIGTSQSKSRLNQLRKDPAPRSFSSFLTDTHAREHNYLRISVTERCNLRCLYCMPEEGVPLSPSSHILTTPEIVYLSSLFVSQGVDKIRLTGGEPTVRRDIVDLMQQIGKLRAHGLKELCLTTNGLSLHRKLDAMLDAGLTGVNLSLDTLDPFQFTLMTRRNGHDAVMKSINRILEMNKAGAGIKLKINCVVMRGLNEREILPFVEMGRDQDLEVRFIEYMPFDGNKWSQKKMLSFQEMLAMIQEKFPDVHKVQDHANDTSKTYKVPGFMGRIGFITSMTHNFCGTCNRLRITSDGNLKVCLFGNREVSLRDILRQSNDGRPIDAEAMHAIRQIESNHRQNLHNQIGTQSFSEREVELLDVIGAAVSRKKAKHAGMGQLENMKNRPMILIDDLFPSVVPWFLKQPPVLPNPAVASFSSRARASSIALHLLAAQSPALNKLSVTGPLGNLGHRSMSTKSPMLRKTYSQNSYRYVEVDDLGSKHIPTPISSQLSDPNSPTAQLRSRTDSAIFPRFYSAEPDDVVPPSGTHASRSKLSHLNRQGEAHMVDISSKTPTRRCATAQATLYFSRPRTFEKLYTNNAPKGDVLAVARIAAIQAAKKTSDLIPLAHPGLGITAVRVKLNPLAPSGKTSPNHKATHTVHEGLHGGIHVIATVDCEGRTGVEMEALTSATVGALTLYDMLKGIDKTMRIDHCRVVKKSGGKSGDWEWNQSTNQIQYKNIRPRFQSSAERHSHTDTELASDSVTNTTTDADTHDYFAALQIQPDQDHINPSETKTDDISQSSISKNTINNSHPSPSANPASETKTSNSFQPAFPRPSHTPIEGEGGEDDVDIKFHRGTRDIMSGTYSDRVDRQSFAVKRMERYQDWVSER